MCIRDSCCFHIFIYWEVETDLESWTGLRKDACDHLVSVGTWIPEKLTVFKLVGHIPCTIRRFWHYFKNHKVKLEAYRRNTKYRSSSIPSGELEIPILVIIKVRTSSNAIYKNIRNFFGKTWNQRKYVARKKLKR